MRLERTSILRGMALLAAAVLLTSCEDQEARGKADAAAKEARDLKDQLSQLQTKVKAAEDTLASLKETLSGQINTRLEKLNEHVTDNEKKLQQEFAQRVEQLQTSTKGNIDTNYQNLMARIDNVVKQDLARSLESIRAEISKHREELLGFMDKQLKELYPYAYQPKRMDPNQQPEAPK